MITAKTIKELYRRYRRPPANRDALGIELLLEQIGKCHGLSVGNDGTNEVLNIGSIPTEAFFHSIIIRHICAIVPFDMWIAIVLPSTIIFLSRESNDVRINLKDLR